MLIKPCVYCMKVSGSEMSRGNEHEIHLSILECLMSPGEGGFDGLWCRINLTYSWRRA